MDFRPWIVGLWTLKKWTLDFGFWQKCTLVQMSAIILQSLIEFQSTKSNSKFKVDIEKVSTWIPLGGWLQNCWTLDFRPFSLWTFEINAYRMKTTYFWKTVFGFSWQREVIFSIGTWSTVSRNDLQNWSGVSNMIDSIDRHFLEQSAKLVERFQIIGKSRFLEP